MSAALRALVALVSSLALGIGGASGRAAQSAPEGLGAIQRQLVARLSGWTEGAGQTVPFSRSTPDERTAAASYLFETLSGLGLEPQRHRYQRPNINWLVDLLVPPYRGTNVFSRSRRRCMRLNT